MSHCRRITLDELQRCNVALLRERKMRPLTVRLHVAAFVLLLCKDTQTALSPRLHAIPESGTSATADPE